MSTKIKIGGLRRLEDVDFVNEAMPDYAGVVLSRRFQRSIHFEEAKAIRKRLNSSIPLVGVFVNDRFTDALVALRQGAVDMVQLQGTESEEYIQDLKFMSRKPVIKACQMDSPSVVPYMVESAADYILMGSNPESGTVFDWSMVKDISRPFILSGGLTPDNLEYAIQTVHPWGVNLTSGVETNSIFDLEKMIKAVSIAHSR